MTVKEMIKKVANYNEVASTLGLRHRKATLYCKIGEIGAVSTEVESFEEFRSWLEDLFIACVGDAVLDCDEYRFDTWQTIVARDSYRDDEFTEPVMFYVSE